MKQYDYYIGVDPGMTGAIAIIDPNGHCFEVADCPTVDGEILYPTIADIFESYKIKNYSMFVGIEKAQSMPKQGVCSVGNYMRGYGVYLGIFASFKIPYREIRPTEWKKSFGLLHQDKSASITKALQLFPYLSDRIYLKKHHGRAEAVLLAQFTFAYSN